jgi:type VI secretion system protein ImpG
MHELFPYYEQELTFMREMASEFAKLHPEVASRLDLERYRCEDPHVERLIEAFCLIAARTHQRLDSELPELTQAFLGLLNPQYFRPVPSMSIAQFALKSEQSTQAESVPIATGETLEAGDICRFRTCYPVRLWPLTVDTASVSDAAGVPVWAAGFGGTAAIQVGLGCKLGLSKLAGFDSLTFYLSGQGPVPFDLYELILNHCNAVLLRDPKRPHDVIEIPLASVRPVGFGYDEGVIPYDAQSFLGFRLVQEYFCFPEKFLFFELGGLDRAVQKGFTDSLEVVLLLDDLHFKGDRFRRLQHSVGPEHFLLGCTPIINLFKKAAEPIRIDPTKAEYLIIPDLYHPNSNEIYSVDSVTSRSFGSRQTRVYKPLYSFRHVEDQALEDTFWNSVRRPSHKPGDRGTEVYLTLVDLSLRPSHPPDEALLVDLTCTNRDLPTNLIFRYKYGELSLSETRVSARCVRRPSAPVRSTLARGLDWRFVSYLGMNYLSLVNEGMDGDLSRSHNADSLREILEVYNFSEDPAFRRKLQGMRSVSSSPMRARIRMRRGHDTIPVFCHGTSVTLDFDEEPFATSGLFLFAAVLERFLALYAPINSFTQVTATTDDGRRVLRQWAPRSGEQILI